MCGSHHQSGSAFLKMHAGSTRCGPARRDLRTLIGHLPTSLWTTSVQKNASCASQETSASHPLSQLWEEAFSVNLNRFDAVQSPHSLPRRTGARALHSRPPCRQRKGRKCVGQGGAPRDPGFPPVAVFYQRCCPVTQLDHTSKTRDVESQSGQLCAWREGDFSTLDALPPCTCRRAAVRVCVAALVTPCAALWHNTTNSVPIWEEIILCFYPLSPDEI